MDFIMLIRRRWFIAFLSISHLCIVWIVFQYIYEEEILINRLAGYREVADPSSVRTIYTRLVDSGGILRSRLQVLYRLVDVLIKAGMYDEAIEVMKRILNLAPENMEMRLRLALLLHNQGRYMEAEPHFIVLLKELERNV